MCSRDVARVGWLRDPNGEPMCATVKHRRGLDYTPLLRFLLSRVGSDWDGVYARRSPGSIAPIPSSGSSHGTSTSKREMVRMGESSYYTGLYVDAAGILRVVNSALRAKDLTPFS